MKVTSFMPAVKLNNVAVSGRCLKQPAQKLDFQNVNVKFAGPSFSPVGAKFKATLKDGKTRINIIPSVGAGSSQINIRKSKVDSKLLGKLIGSNNAFSGLFTVDANIKMDKNKISKGATRIKSKDLVILPRSISGFEIPRLNLKSLD